jgi:hypothetical protein
MKDERRDEQRRDDELDGGAFIGNRPELASETIPGGVDEDDERVAGADTQSSGAQGGDDEWPRGHRDA